MNIPVLASPCTGVCKLDPATGWCLGCARSGEEIAEWRAGSDVWRKTIWDKIPDRLAQLGVRCRRLPWTTEAIRSFVIETLHAGRGRWHMGVLGVGAVFAPPVNEETHVTVHGEKVVARTEGGALQMVVNDDVRALSFDPQETPRDACRVVLVVKRERGRLPLSAGISDLGPDMSALTPEKAGRLFDLGLARMEARFCVRAPDGPVPDALTALSGTGFEAALPHVSPFLLEDGPTMIMETALGCIEVAGGGRMSDERAPTGPHMHLKPELLSTLRSMPLGMELPRAYLPGAVFYPSKGRR